MALCKHASVEVHSLQPNEEVPMTENTTVEKDGMEYLCTPETCKIGKENCEPEQVEDLVK